MKNSKMRRFSLLTLALASMTLVACGSGETSGTTEAPNTNPPSITAPESNIEPPVTTPTEPETTPGTEGTTPVEKVYTLAEAAAKANEVGETPSDPIIIKGTIKSISSYIYGEMILADETGELSIYGVRGENDEFFDKLDYIPKVGDTLTLRGPVCTFKGTPQMKKGNIVELEKTHTAPNAEEYKATTIADARKEKDGTKIKLTGVVAKNTLTQKKNPNGFYLVDSTGAFYIFGGASAVQVTKGNTVTVLGEVAHYISSKEASFAQALGYTGSMQLDNTYILENDKGNATVDYSWAQEKTVKEMLDINVKDENITNVVYKTQAIIKKVPGSGFVNYYINDFDGTGSYVYTSNNGSDFAYLDEFVDVPVEVYLTICNYKCTDSGAIARFIPLEVSKIEHFVYPEDKFADFALNYGAMPQFETEYAGDPSLEVITTYSNDILGIKDVKIEYASSNEALAYFETIENKTTFHVNPVADQTANITVTATYKTYQATSEITVSYRNVTGDAGDVKSAVDAADTTSVKIRGIVGQKTINKDGFYLIDKTGAIAVTVADASSLDNIHTGDEVVISGTKNHVLKEGFVGAGQAVVEKSTIDGVVSVDNTIPTDSFITNVDFDTLSSYEVSADITSAVYTVSAYAFKTDGQFAQLKFYKDEASSTTSDAPYISVYSSSPSQFSFADSMVNKQVTVTFAFVNWNSKNYYRMCPLSITDGVNTVSNNL